MNIHQLDRFFNPQRIVLIGVTSNPKNVGGKILGNLIGVGFQGVVYPVNPAFEAVMGIPCYPDLKSLPRLPDLAILCAPAGRVPDLVRECGEAGVLALIIVSSGLRETGPEGKELEARVLAEAARFSGMRILGAYGIPVSKPVFARTAEEAVRTAEKVGYPVVLKIQSPDISHKTDVGGVVLDLGDSDQVRAAFQRVMNSAAAASPRARLEGVTIQPMIRSKEAVEMILGAKKDPTFGTVMIAGMGGTMIRLSYLVADHPEIKELDINPLLVSPLSVVALDARIVVDRNVGADAEPFAHLALRPYPEHYVKDIVLEDGSACRLRPIKPEDEPMWLELLAGCSRESIYSRFRYFFHWESHEVAARYCYIDYDRELAIVAEAQEANGRRLMGVGRLAADPMKTTAEYAVLVGDAWQDKSLGGVLTDYCLDIAGDWGVRKITAVTTADNSRMIAVFKKRGFSIRFDEDGSAVEVEKNLE